MKLTLDADTRLNLIRSYSNGELHAGEHVFHRSCLLMADAVTANWRPTDVDDLQEADLEPIFALRPELVLLGTGNKQRFPPVTVRGAFAKHGVGLEAMDFGAACRTFNILVQEERRVLAALLFGEDRP